MKNKHENKENKKEDFDDGRTIADMSILYSGKEKNKQKQNEKKDNGFKELNLTKKERKAMLFAALQVSLVIGAVFIAIYALIFLLLQAGWLHYFG